MVPPRRPCLPSASSSAPTAVASSVPATDARATGRQSAEASTARTSLTVPRDAFACWKTILVCKTQKSIDLVTWGHMPPITRAAARRPAARCQCPSRGARGACGPQPEGLWSAVGSRIGARQDCGAPWGVRGAPRRGALGPLVSVLRGTWRTVPKRRRDLQGHLLDLLAKRGQHRTGETERGAEHAEGGEGFAASIPDEGRRG